MPNWKKFQKVVKQMIETDLGGESCTITIPATISYDYDDGEIISGETETSFKSALIKTNKDDLQDMPEGIKEKVHKKIFTVNPIIKVNKIKSDFDGVEYKVIVPSAAYQAGGLVHAYVTYLSKIEVQS